MTVVERLVAWFVTCLCSLSKRLLRCCSCECELVLRWSLKWLITICSDAVAGLFAIEVVSRPYRLLPIDIWASCVELSFQMGILLETVGDELLYCRGARIMNVHGFAVGETDLKSTVEVAMTPLIVWSLALLVSGRGWKL